MWARHGCDDEYVSWADEMFQKVEERLPRGPRPCIGATASASTPLRRYVLVGKQEFYTQAECCMYPGEDEEEMDEEEME